MGGSLECLHRNIITFSGEFWDLPMWKWASGVMATSSSMLPRGDGIFEFRMWHIRASQRSIPAICFTNCFPSVRQNLALDVQCSSSPCLPHIKYRRMYLRHIYIPAQCCRNLLCQICVLNSSSCLVHAVYMSSSWKSSIFAHLEWLVLLLNFLPDFLVHSTDSIQPPTWAPGVTHQTGLVQWTWKITSISNDPDAKDEHDGASS